MNEKAEAEEQDPSSESGGPSTSRPRRFLRWLLAISLMAAIAAAGLGFYGFGLYRAPGPSQAETIVKIPRGSGVIRIADILQSAGVIEHPDLFRLAVFLRGDSSALKAGHFNVPAGASLQQAIDVLIEGKSIAYKITIPEGLTSFEIVQLLRDDERLSGAIAKIPDEGTLLPETYFVEPGTDRATILKRMRQAQKRAIDELWPGRADDLPISTPEEAIILASIVEKETGLTDERAKVASVFENRLRQGIRLQSDPTIIYGIKLGEGGLGRRIRRSEISAYTDYNTYKIDGLPPGPICNPGRKAIAAVLNPAETDYIFFVADGTGGHQFSRTYSEHKKNVERWRAVRDGN